MLIPIEPTPPVVDPRFQNNTVRSMIRPSRQIKLERYIHAAPAAVWQKFTRLPSWPTWYPGVAAVAWLEGDRWQENHCFVVTTSQGERHRFIIRMVAPDAVTVWESMSASLNVVYSLHCTDQVGGCKVTIRCTYFGMSALRAWVQFGQQEAYLAAILDALKATFPPRAH